jgi:hypothetical protein
MWVWSKACLVTVLTLWGAASVNAQAPIPEREAAVRAVFTRHVKDQTRILNCLAVIEPERVTVAQNDWVEILESTRDVLENGKFPPESMTVLFAAAQPDKIMTSADPAKMRASCEADKAWEKHWFEFRAYTLIGDIREIVEGRR